MAEKKEKFDLEKIYKDIDEVVESMRDEINRVADEAYEEGEEEEDRKEGIVRVTDETADK